MPTPPPQTKEKPAWLGRLDLASVWDDELLTIRAIVDGIRLAWTTASLHHPAMRINDLIVDDDFDTRRLTFLGRLRHRRPLTSRGNGLGRQNHLLLGRR